MLDFSWLVGKLLDFLWLVGKMLDFLDSVSKCSLFKLVWRENGVVWKQKGVSLDLFDFLFIKF